MLLSQLSRRTRAETLATQAIGTAKLDISKTGYFPHPLPLPPAKTKKSNVTLRATRVQRQISYSGGHCRGRWGDQKVFIRSRVVSNKNFGGFS